MMKIKEYSFLILLVSLLLIFTTLFFTITQMSFASIIALTSSIFVFVIYFFNKEENGKVLKIINILVQNIFIIFLALFVLIALYASPDHTIYSKESSIFLLSFAISLASIILYTNMNIFFLIIYTLFATFFIVSFSMVYRYSNPAGIEDGLASAIGVSGLLVLVVTIYYEKFHRKRKSIEIHK